jgi:ribosomal protein S18 acetylase RimI-like enzyme
VTTSGPDPRIAELEDLMRVFALRVPAEGPDGVVDRSRPGLWAISSERPTPFLNQVGWADPDHEDPAGLVAEVVAEYGARGVPWWWTTTPGSTSPGLEAALGAAGLVRDEAPGMHLRLPTGLPHVDGPPEREVVVSDRITARPAATMVRAFGMPADEAEVVVAVHEALHTGEEILVEVVDGGRSVGVAMGYPDGDGVLVGNVATLADARGRGVGTAATVAVLAVAQERGLGTAVLCSSPEGHALYRRLGFEDVCTTSTWHWSPSVGPTG